MHHTGLYLSSLSVEQPLSRTGQIGGMNKASSVPPSNDAGGNPMDEAGKQASQGAPGGCVRLGWAR